MSNPTCFSLIRWAFWGDRLSPFMFALVVSLGSAVVAWLDAKELVEWGRKGRSHSNHSSKN